MGTQFQLSFRPLKVLTILYCMAGAGLPCDMAVMRPCFLFFVTAVRAIFVFGLGREQFRGKTAWGRRKRFAA